MMVCPWGKNPKPIRKKRVKEHRTNTVKTSKKRPKGNRNSHEEAYIVISH